MKKAFLIILAVMLILSAFVSCNYDGIVDDAFAYVTISFDANGGTGSMEAVQVMPHASYRLPENVFTAPDGKRFKEWTGADEWDNKLYRDGGADG